jgi:hypothetical protein
MKKEGKALALSPPPLVPLRRNRARESGPELIRSDQSL